MNKIEEEIIDAINSIKSQAYRITKIYLLPNPVTQGVTTFMGIDVEHKILYNKDGELQEILFEVEKD